MGGRPCPVCLHSSRHAIEQALVNGKSMAGIAKDFGFTYTAHTGRYKDTQVGDHTVIKRHRDKCMAQAYQAAVAEKMTESGKAIQSRMNYLDAQVDVAIKDALKGRVVMVGDTPMLDPEGKPVYERTTSDLRILLAAVSQGRANADLIAKLSGAVPDADSAELDRIRAAQGTPEARRLLARMDEELARLEADAEPTPD